VRRTHHVCYSNINGLTALPNIVQWQSESRYSGCKLPNRLTSKGLTNGNKIKISYENTDSSRQVLPHESEPSQFIKRGPALEAGQAYFFLRYFDRKKKQELIKLLIIKHGGTAFNRRQPLNTALELFHQAQTAANIVSSQFRVFLFRTVFTTNSDYFPIQH
jgi:hypothetical protein